MAVNVPGPGEKRKGLKAISYWLLAVSLAVGYERGERTSERKIW